MRLSTRSPRVSETVLEPLAESTTVLGSLGSVTWDPVKIRPGGVETTFSALGSFAAGVGASLLASWIWSKIEAAKVDSSGPEVELRVEIERPDGRWIILEARSEDSVAIDLGKLLDT